MGVDVGDSVGVGDVVGDGPGVTVFVGVGDGPGADRLLGSLGNFWPETGWKPACRFFPKC